MNPVEKVYHELQTPQLIIDATVLKIESILKNKYPDYISYDNGSFTINQGSTQVMIIVRPYTSFEAAIEFVATVVVGAKVTDGLMRYLLEANTEIHYGAFGLMFDETITFSHTISASNLSSDDFTTALSSVATISDFYDDIIVQMAGGKRATDIEDLNS